MIGFLSRRLSPAKSEPQPARVPDGSRIYAIGDIHGRYDLLLSLQQRIVSDAQAYPEMRRVVIYLGDYIDRGPNNREVLDQLIDNPLPGFESIHLMGNHEQSLLSFLREPETFGEWLLYGGLATLNSYGVQAAACNDKNALERAADELEASLPEPHKSFLSSLETYRVFGDYLFVHAGIRPGVAIEQQHPRDMLWIRDEFLRYQKPHSHTIVHGHHIVDEPDIRPNRIGIDTGAFATGCLTCIILDGESRSFLDTRRR